MLLIILRIYASSLLIWKNIPLNYNQGRILDFKLGGAHLKTFALSGGRRENFWGLSCEKNHIFSNFRGGRARAPGAPPGSTPDNILLQLLHVVILTVLYLFIFTIK
jgi:hypothetical protein